MAFAPGDTLQLEICDIAFGGEGVARHEDFVLFVPFTAVGDVIEARLTEVKKRFARAELLRLIHPSALRVQPLCQYFTQCGGCQYQHIQYSAQLSLKHKQVADIFERIGGFSPGLVRPPIPCPSPYHYRNRLMIRSQWDKFKQGLNIGFIRADSRLVIDIVECKIAEPAINEQILHVRAHPPPKGGLKVVLRLSPDGWVVPPDSFFQNNFALLPELVRVVREQVTDAAPRHLVDVYCGVGFFSLELADLVHSYAGVELDRLAIRAARQNATLRHRTNGEFVDGSAEEQLPQLLARFKAEDSSVLLDPPRKGCHPELIATLRAVKPRQIIYISCQPATMARDLQLLCAEGLYQLRHVTPLDMFPQTAHVECVADLRLVRAPDETPTGLGYQDAIK